MRRAKANAQPQGTLGTPGHLQQQAQANGDGPPTEVEVAEEVQQAPALTAAAPTASSSSSSGKRQAGVLPSILSGLICGLVIFVFCCVFSSMIFDAPAYAHLLGPALPLGVGMNTVSTLVGGLVFARLSGCKAVIAGPDINPCVSRSRSRDLWLVNSPCIPALVPSVAAANPDVAGSISASAGPSSLPRPRSRSSAPSAHWTPAASTAVRLPRQRRRYCRRCWWAARSRRHS